MIMSLSNKRNRGFTLIELVVAMMICAILASLAIPSYRTHIVRSRRTAAQAAMMDITVREQQFMVANRDVHH
ncbi:prepilin-type N-terminal cleavage/methylation domain-containing protein, partial [bacterium]